MNRSGFTQQRIIRLRESMAQKGITYVVLMKPENVMYYSGFNPIINSNPAIFILSLEGEPILLVHALRKLHAEEESDIKRIELYGQWGHNTSLAGTFQEAIAILVDKKNIVIGLELDYISVDVYSSLCKILHISDTVSISNVINYMRCIKDDYEIEMIRKAAHLVDCGIEKTIAALQGGESEAQASTLGQYAMRQLWHKVYPEFEVCGYGTSEGGMVDSLHVWCLSNDHIAYGCDAPRHYIPKSGDVTLPMAWAKVNGYHAENERTILVGDVSGIRLKAYDAMLKAREMVFGKLEIGTKFSDLYKIAADVFTEAGFGHVLPGRIGHGIGCSAHEVLSLSRQSEHKITPGMVLSIEPGVMSSEWGGARHSDTVLICEDEYEIVTKLPSGRITI